MPMDAARGIRKVKNGMNPQTELMPDEQVLFSEVCTVGTEKSHLQYFTGQKCGE